MRGQARSSVISKVSAKSLDFMILSLVSGSKKALYQKYNDSQFTLLIFSYSIGVAKDTESVYSF